MLDGVFVVVVLCLFVCLFVCCCFSPSLPAGKSLSCSFKRALILNVEICDSPGLAVWPVLADSVVVLCHAGMDYHFQRSVLYFTTNSVGTGFLERLDMTAMTAAEGRITLIAQGRHMQGSVWLLLLLFVVVCFVFPVVCRVTGFCCSVLWCLCFLL